MTSITTFAYGLTVRATGLITAAHAWTSLEPTFDFFDLLFLRKRKGTLQSRLSGPTREAIIGKVPVEVWEEIRKWVVVIEMEDKEDSLIRQFSIPCGDEDCNCQGVTKVTWELLKQGTSYCVSLEWLSHGVSLGEFLDRFSSGYGDAIELIERLTARFGLAHPLARQITYNEEWLDLDGVALISLPCRISPQEHTTISAGAEHDNGGRDQHTIVDVSLNVPPDADARFVRFIHLFDLEVVQVTHSVIEVTRPQWKKRESVTRGSDQWRGVAGIESDKVKVTKEIKPGWKLYTSCWYSS